ncbi:hypothetical protein L2E82_50612 [Cichorium intybus]|nr:hypothetical protein L2E82_50612 [Cichorium intybus]
MTHQKRKGETHNVESSDNRTITPHLSRGNFCSESNPNFFPLQPRIHQSNFLLESLLIDSIEYFMME